MASTLNIKEIQLFNPIKTKFGEKEAEEFVSLIKDEIEERITEKHQSISKEIAHLREDLFTHFASKEFVEKKISGVEKKISEVEIKISEVEIKISEAKFQIILWAFVFWVTQLGAIFAFLKLFVK